jgi:hypothetical protein
MKFSLFIMIIALSLSAWSQGPASRPAKINNQVWNNICQYASSSVANAVNMDTKVLGQVNWNQIHDGLKNKIAQNCAAGYSPDNSPMKGTYDVWAPHCQKLKGDEQLNCIHAFNHQQAVIDGYSEGALKASELLQRVDSSDCGSAVVNSDRSFSSDKNTASRTGAKTNSSSLKK